VIWRSEFETIDCRTPKEVRQTWVDAREEFDGLQQQAA
jgi:hypothetical protein